MYTVVALGTDTQNIKLEKAAFLNKEVIVVINLAAFETFCNSNYYEYILYKQFALNKYKNYNHSIEKKILLFIYFFMKITDNNFTVFLNK